MQRTDIFRIKARDETFTGAAGEISSVVRVVRRLYGVVWSDINPNDTEDTELTITYDDQWINRPVITQVLKGLGLSSAIFTVPRKQTRAAHRPKNQAMRKAQYHRKIHIRDTCICPALFMDTIR